nr:D-sedoheptulose 7-phosphate isomerase [Chloroflexota bacterium]
MKDRIISRAIQENMEVQRQVLEQCVGTIAQIAAVLVRALQEGHKVVLFGNGGSAADAQHVTAELVNRFLINRAALPAIALTTNSSILTSVSNDVSFDQVFARQVEALAQEGDVVVGISTSGNSPSVLNGIVAAKEKGAITVGFTGRSGGKLKGLVDHCFCVPSDHTPRIQETHITVWHAICELIEQELFGT